mmetsp:Transcript_139053/g.444057  ORF Transcript_139053/g.444057 Transcript_139053/m.444057 type:complete len:257 (+) Transcript_139053:148-918(+)
MARRAVGLRRLGRVVLERRSPQAIDRGVAEVVAPGLHGQRGVHLQAEVRKAEHPAEGPAEALASHLDAHDLFSGRVEDDRLGLLDELAGHLAQRLERGQGHEQQAERPREGQHAAGHGEGEAAGETPGDRAQHQRRAGGGRNRGRSRILERLQEAAVTIPPLLQREVRLAPRRHRVRDQRPGRPQQRAALRVQAHARLDAEPRVVTGNPPVAALGVQAARRSGHDLPDGILMLLAGPDSGDHSSDSKRQESKDPSA